MALMQAQKNHSHHLTTTLSSSVLVTMLSMLVCTTQPHHLPSSLLEVLLNTLPHHATKLLVVSTLSLLQTEVHRPSNSPDPVSTLHLCVVVFLDFVLMLTYSSQDFLLQMRARISESDESDKAHSTIEAHLVLSMSDTMLLSMVDLHPSEPHPTQSTTPTFSPSTSKDLTSTKSCDHWHLVLVTWLLIRFLMCQLATSTRSWYIWENRCTNILALIRVSQPHSLLPFSTTC